MDGQTRLTLYAPTTIVVGHKNAIKIYILNRTCRKDNSKKAMLTLIDVKYKSKGQKALKLT